MAAIINELNARRPLAVILSDNRYQVAAEALREEGIVKIEPRLVPRFPDNGRSIWSLQQQQLRVVAYYVTFTDAGEAIYGDRNV